MVAVARRSAPVRADSAVAARLSVHRGTPSGTPLTVGHAAASSRRAPARATRDAPPPTPDRTKTGRVRAPRGCRWPRTRGGMATRRSHGSALQVSRAAGERGAKNCSEQREETTCARRGAAAAAGRRHTTRSHRATSPCPRTANSVGSTGVTRAAGRCPFGPCMM